MKLSILKNKWFYFKILIAIYVVLGILFWDNAWEGAFLQIGAICLTIYFSALLNIENNKHRESQTEERLKALEESTESQISALWASTNKQVTNYSDETGKLVNELGYNSVLLTGILKLNMEIGIRKMNEELSNANINLATTKSFKFFRTKAEKQKMIGHQETVVTNLRKKLVHFNAQYENLLKIIDQNEGKLDG